jgi:hypothetical protein
VPVYYPSLAVNLRIRFEESMNLTLPDPESPDSITDSPSAFPSTKKLTPLFMTGQKDRLSQILGLVPKMAEIAVNGYRQASTFSLTLEWRDFPIDPRLIRAIGVEVYLDSVNDGDFARGIINPTLGRRVSVVVPDDTPITGNQVLVGTGDEISTQWNDKGIIVHLEGRNNVGILIDLPFSPASLHKLKHNQTISDVVRQILSFHPEGKDLPVKVVSDDFANQNEFPNGEPVLANPGDLTQVQMGASGQQPGVDVKGDAASLTFWDIITQYCWYVGVVPFFSGEELHLRPARKLFELQQAEMSFDPVGGRTPFRGGGPRFVRTGTGRDSRTEKFLYRRMVYGQNIHDLKFDRKLGGRKPPLVICYSANPSSMKGRGAINKTVQASWPDAASGTIDPNKLKKQKVTTVAPSGEVTQQEVIRIPVPGIASENRLRGIARQIYEEISRQEVGGSCATKELASFGGDNDDADLCKLRAGDAVEFRIPASSLSSPVVNQVVGQNSMSFEQAVAAVKKRLGGVDDSLARAIVATSRNAVPELQRTFRVGNVKYGWDASSGLAIDFDFQNYIEARNDVELPKTKKAAVG